MNLQAAGIETDNQGFIPVDDQGRTSSRPIFAIGDVVAGPALAHKASYEAKVASAGTRMLLWILGPCRKWSTVSRKLRR